MSDFADLYGGSGALLLPGSFGGFRTGWAYPVPPATTSAFGAALSDRIASNQVRLTPFLVPPGASATTSRIWCRTTQSDYLNSSSESTEPGAGNNLRVAIYSVGNSGVLTRVGSDVEINLQGPWGPKSGALSAAIAGGSQGTLYIIACNKTGPDNINLASSVRGGAAPFSNANGQTEDAFFGFAVSLAGVPYSGSTLPADPVGGRANGGGMLGGWALQGNRTYGAFPATLNILTDLTSLQFSHTMPQFLVGF